MNRSDLALRVAQDTGLSQAQSKAVIDSVLGAITQELANQGEVRLAGFGSFVVKQRKSRTCYGPIGQGRVVPAKNVPAFRPATALKEAVE